LELWIPYGETEIPVRVSDDNFYRILEPRKPVNPPHTTVVVEQALAKPVAGFSLEGLVKPGGIAGIIVDPLIPPDIRKMAVQTLKSRLAVIDVNDVRIFLRKRLSLTPSSQGPTTEEQFRVLDPAQRSYTEIGKTSLGTSVNLEQELLSCEIRIGIGMVLPHFAIGFTGGPDLVLPGASSIQTITKNRSLLVKGPSSSFNSGENPILSDSLEAYKLAGPFYSVCFVPDGWGGVDSAFSGEMESTYREAVSRYLSVHSHKIERRSDIVVLSAGQILGRDLYHAVRVLANTLSAVKKDGTIVLVAECSAGVGDSNFLDYARRFRERKELANELRYRFKLGGHVNLFLRDILEKYRVQVVSVLPELYTRDAFGLKPSRTASEAVQKAVRAEGKDSKILIVTRGDLTLPVVDLT
jgi:nickel-dependent lactate racemase